MNLEKQFEEIFDFKADSEYFAPGRINLIGEHIDYNGGHVFPCALTFGTYALYRKREDQVIRLYSLNFEGQGIVEIDLDNLAFDKEDDWANYIKGVLYLLLQDKKVIDHGFDILFYGNIPNGAGLSSSASLTVAMSTLLNYEFDLALSKLDIVYLTQAVENKYMGVNTGIMDQYAITFGQQAQAMLLNTNQVRHEYVPLDLQGHSIVIMNTNKRRGLTDSKYNERRAECEKALEILQEKESINHLCDLSLNKFEQYQDLFQDQVLLKRARHAISENERTLKSKEVLEAGDLIAFGQLMNESHRSLRDDYEVTGIELDTLVERAWQDKHCLGARVTGAGFGGCAIALVKNEAVDEFIQTIGDHYQSKIGYSADFYTAQVGAGAQKISK